MDIPAGPVWVTLVYMGIYYWTQVRILQIKTRLRGEYKARDEKFDRYFGQDREMLAADRVQLNMLEHMPPFLILMWLTAFLASPMEATVAGGIYTASRVVYPFIMGGRLGRGVPNRILLATATGYLVLAFFVVRIVMGIV
mgnify:CR=1 FL=1